MIFVALGIIVGALIGSAAGVFSVDLWFRGRKAAAAMLFSTTAALGVTCIVLPLALA